MHSSIRRSMPPTRSKSPESQPRGRREKVRNQRLTQAVRKPHRALTEGWFQDPDFCQGLFDRCDHLAFLGSRAVLELAHRAVTIAEENGDPHLVNRSYGVLAHAFISRWDLRWAGKVLEGQRRSALECCPSCRSDFFRREGDLLGESRDIEGSLEALNRSIEVVDEELDPGTLGQICFLRSIAFHHGGHRDQALDDAGETLACTSLEAPRGFFLDTPALIAIYVGGGDACHDLQALEHLEHFEARIRGRRRWKAVRTRLFWVKGHLYARTGDMRRSRLCLERAQTRLIAEGLAREAVAVTLDLAQLRCRQWQPWGGNEAEAQRLISRCLKGRSDLKPEHREGLEHLRDVVLSKYPESAFTELCAFRRSFIAPVPGVLSERIGGS